ncbi:MAG: hypothetical protein ACOZF0_13195 [Thermodesulfobacteriota bacterium]
MPTPERPEYNPYIIGFTEHNGPVCIPLQEARRLYGRLPSDYRFVSPKNTRKNKKGLNLAAGRLITELLEKPGFNLKAAVFGFFDTWHRDYAREFDLRLEPFCNLNPPSLVGRIIRDNQEELLRAGKTDLRPFLADGFIRRDVLNSIPERELPQAAAKILTRKIASIGAGERSAACRKALALVLAKDILARLFQATSFDVADPKSERLAVFADEIAMALFEIGRITPLAGTGGLICPAGREIDYEFARRDSRYLLLGKQTGDCTADKKTFQADRHVENIYWTVFPWILDRNYQILKVFHQGVFVMKAHLLPLFILRNGEGRMALAVDAIETVRALRDDLSGQCQDGLLENREPIFYQVIREILRLAEEMGIERVYAETFSNTPWVREAFKTFPEIFLHVNQIVKVDELEDVYCFTRELSRKAGFQPPTDIFMELQMKNTSLVPRLSKKLEGVKAYAVLKGDPEEGIPMKRVFGI